MPAARLSNFIQKEIVTPEFILGVKGHVYLVTRFLIIALDPYFPDGLYVTNCPKSVKHATFIDATYPGEAYENGAAPGAKLVVGTTPPWTTRRSRM
jgi:hypothetical protein